MHMTMTIFHAHEQQFVLVLISTFGVAFLGRFLIALIADNRRPRPTSYAPASGHARDFALHVRIPRGAHNVIELIHEDASRRAEISEAVCKTYFGSR